MLKYPCESKPADLWGQAAAARPDRRAVSPVLVWSRGGGCENGHDEGAGKRQSSHRGRCAEQLPTTAVLRPVVQRLRPERRSACRLDPGLQGKAKAHARAARPPVRICTATGPPRRGRSRDAARTPHLPHGGSLLASMRGAPHLGGGRHGPCRAGFVLAPGMGAAAKRPAAFLSSA